MRAAYMRLAKKNKLQRVYMRRCIEAGCCLQRRVCRLDVYLCVCMCVRERCGLGDDKTYIGVWARGWEWFSLSLVGVV